jgi:CheY-like chemotaxis protein
VTVPGSPDSLSAADWQVVLVLTDVQRGAIGILTALRRLRALPHSDACPIIGAGEDICGAGAARDLPAAAVADSSGAA